MKNRFNPIVTATLVLLDLLILNLCFIYTFLLQYRFRPDAFSAEFWGFVFYINFIWIIIAVAFRLYNSYRMERIGRILIPAFLSIVIFFFFFLIYFQIVTFNYLDREKVKYYFMVFALLMIVVKSAEHLLMPYLVRLINKPLKAIIVGYSASAKELADFFEKDLWSNYRFMGYFTDRHNRNEPILGDYTKLKDYLDSEQTDDVFLLLNLIPKDLQKEIVQLTKNQYTTVHLVPDLSLFSMMNVALQEFGNVPALQIQRGPLSKWQNKLLKRTFDLVLSTIVIAGLLSWITPLIWLLNKLLYGQGPFFFQSRNGLNNMQFKCIKFRSMYINALADKTRARKKDYRVTPLGKFLRKTSLDELPQFINVFLGHMSVVGPRPHMLRHTALYRKTQKEFMIRHTVKPGLTGLAQVNGFRGSIFDKKQLRNRVKMDIKYIENWTLWMDIKIVLLTILNVLKGDKNAF